MTVKELIEQLTKFDGKLEVQYDDTEEYDTVPLTEVYIQNESYNLLGKKVVVLS